MALPTIFWCASFIKNIQAIAYSMKNLFILGEKRKSIITSMAITWCQILHTHYFTIGQEIIFVALDRLLPTVMAWHDRNSSLRSHTSPVRLLPPRNIVNYFFTISFMLLFKRVQSKSKRHAKRVSILLEIVNFFDRFFLTSQKHKIYVDIITWRRKNEIVWIPEIYLDRNDCTMLKKEILYRLKPHTNN